GEGSNGYREDTVIPPPQEETTTPTWELELKSDDEKIKVMALFHRPFESVHLPGIPVSPRPGQSATEEMSWLPYPREQTYSSTSGALALVDSLPEKTRDDPQAHLLFSDNGHTS